MTPINNADELYEYMKHSLKFFMIDFHKKQEMKLFVKDGKLIFASEGAEVSFPIQLEKLE